MAAKIGNQYGLLDVQGNIIAPFLYDELVSETRKKITGLYNEISRHKAVALFIKNGDFGYLNAFGEEKRPITPPFLDNDSGFKTYELPGLLSFTYPYSWKRNNHHLNLGEEYGNAHVSVSTITYSGDFKEWLNSMSGGATWQMEIIAGARVYHKTEKKIGFIGFTEQEGYFQEVFVETNGQNAVQIVTKANTANYPKLAQDLYNLRHSIQLIH